MDAGYRALSAGRRLSSRGDEAAELYAGAAFRACPALRRRTRRAHSNELVNNVLCFPFIFRGALDVGASTINRAMEIAAVEAIAGLARMEASEVVAAAYGGAAPRRVWRCVIWSTPTRWPRSTPTARSFRIRRS
ncbi:MAG: hypothetical protein B7Z73_10325 [Planctomycetia bacterium 21-64-5]|nr:MAG: hypothetical protein B7Z73_10325 [Planctomycetia bacterium 21-64-5]